MNFGGVLGVIAFAKRHTTWSKFSKISGPVLGGQKTAQIDNGSRKLRAKLFFCRGAFSGVFLEAKLQTTKAVFGVFWGTHFEGSNGARKRLQATEVSPAFGALWGLAVAAWGPISGPDFGG